MGLEKHRNSGLQRLLSRFPESVIRFREAGSYSIVVKGTNIVL